MFNSILLWQINNYDYKFAITYYLYKIYQLYKNYVELEYFYKSEHKSDRDMAAALIRKIISDPEQYNNETNTEKCE